MDHVETGVGGSRWYNTCMWICEGHQVRCNHERVDVMAEWLRMKAHVKTVCDPRVMP